MPGCHFDHPNTRKPGENPDIREDELINADNIIKFFEDNVINVILGNAYHANRIPTCTYDNVVYQCVPSSELGVNQYLEPDNNIWNELKISGDIVTALINITSMFTNVGTFAWQLKKVTSGYPDGSGITNATTVLTSMSGTCIFNKDKYTRTLASLPDVGGVGSNTEIRAGGLVSLINACLQAWKNTSKYSYTGSYTITDTCHENCHTDCHTNSDCHDNCYSDCHTNTCHSECYTDCYSKTCYTEPTCYIDPLCKIDCFTMCHSNSCNSNCYSGMNR